MYIPSFALPIYNTACHAKPYLCYLYRNVPYLYLSTVFVSLLLSHFPFDEIYLSASSPLSAFLLLLLLLLVVLLPSVRLVYKIFFFIFRLLRYTDVCFFALSGVLFPRE